MQAAIAVERSGTRSVLRQLYASAPLRLLTPHAGDAAWLVQSSLGGGLVDGDDVSLELALGTGTTAVLTTQASTKAYKGNSGQRLHAAVAEGAMLSALPDPLVCYKGSSYRQHLHYELAAGASLV